MWELIKNDPILKTIAVIILGMFAFSFAFSIMFGSGSSGMENEMASGGINAANSLGQIILLLSKLLIILILVAIIIAGIKFIQKHIIGNEPIKGVESLKDKPLASILAGIGGILVLLLVTYMISPSGNSTGEMKNTLNYGYMGYNMGITGLIVTILNLLKVLSIIGLIIGAAMYFKEQYFSSVKKTAVIEKEHCSKCGNELKSHWKCCPNCGTEKLVSTTEVNGEK